MKRLLPELNLLELMMTWKNENPQEFRYFLCNKHVITPTFTTIGLNDSLHGAQAFTLKKQNKTFCGLILTDNSSCRRLSCSIGHNLQKRHKTRTKFRRLDTFFFFNDMIVILRMGDIKLESLNKLERIDPVDGPTLVSVLGCKHQAKYAAVPKF